MRTRKRTADRRRPATPVALGAPLAAAALAALALLTTAAPATAADPTAAPAAATAPAAPGSAPAPAGPLPAEATQAERLAAELRKDPVYISADQPRRTPRSLAPEFAAVARRTGVPTYVLVLPDADRTLLAQVHDRLGIDGLYVLVQKYGGLTVSAFGVDLPAEDAARIANHVTPYDAGPLAGFTVFADKVRLGKDQVAAEALATGRHHDDYDGRYISATDRQNQNLLLGLAVVVLPGLLLALGLRLSRRRGLPRPAEPAPAARRPGAVDLGKRPAVAPARAKGPTAKNPARSTVAKNPGNRKKAGQPAPAPLRRTVLAVTLPATAAAVLGVVLAAPVVFPQTVDGPDLTVTRADLDARTTEAAAALAADGIYQDPSAPTVLTPAQLAAVRQRTAELAAKTPVYLLFTGSDSDDESGGSSSILLAQVHQRTGRDGVYVQVDPAQGYFELAEFGPAGTDAPSRFRRADLRYPDRSTASDDLRVPERLNSVLDTVAAAQPTGEPAYGNGPTALPELRSNKLPPLFSSDFGPGLMLGAMLYGVLLLLAWAATAVTRAVVRSRRALAAGPTPSQHAATGPRRTAARPSARQLRAWAAEDTRALAVRLAATDQDAPGRTRAWDCLDAAELLLGEDAGRTADPSDLAAATALARAGSDALHGSREPRLCRLNPLHGAADGGKVPYWFPVVDLGTGTARLCTDCRDALQRSGANRPAADRATRRAEADKLLLRVPGADGRTETADWDRSGRVLPAALENLDALVLRARESASVQ